MKVKIVKKCALGKVGETISGPEVWRHAFPCKGCTAKPADQEAANRIGRELSLVERNVRERLFPVMLDAGTLPESEMPEHLKSNVVPEVPAATDELPATAEAPKSVPKPSDAKK